MRTLTTVNNRRLSISSLLPLFPLLIKTPLDSKLGRAILIKLMEPHLLMKAWHYNEAINKYRAALIYFHSGKFICLENRYTLIVLHWPDERIPLVYCKKDIQEIWFKVLCWVRKQELLRRPGCSCCLPCKLPCQTDYVRNEWKTTFCVPPSTKIAPE